MKNLMKLQLLVIAFVLLIAGSAFASLSYSVSVDTGSLSGTDGYLYMQYIPVVDAVNSSATVSNFVTNGTLGSQSLNVVNGAAVSGSLPGTVVFTNTNGINDYNHAIHFGNSLSFNLLLDSANFGTQQSLGSSTFSLGLFQDELGSTPLITSDGTLVSISLNNNGTATTQVMSPNVTATPIPPTALLFGSSLIGLVGLRRRAKN